MKRLIWAFVMSAVAIGGGLTAPMSASVMKPCHKHKCHNNGECDQIGCVEGCNETSHCNRPKPG